MRTMDAQSLATIRAGLKRHRGSFKMLAIRTGKSHDLVRSVLRGTRRNDKVVLEAAKLWKELEAERANALAEAQQLASQAAELTR